MESENEKEFDHFKDKYMWPQSATFKTLGYRIHSVAASFFFLILTLFLFTFYCFFIATRESTKDYGRMYSSIWTIIISLMTFLSISMIWCGFMFDKPKLFYVFYNVMNITFYMFIFIPFSSLALSGKLNNLLIEVPNEKFETILNHIAYYSFLLLFWYATCIPMAGFITALKSCHQYLHELQIFNEEKKKEETKVDCNDNNC